jgi:aspartyl-tRNA(Asn)/glutamyl-tRNA(Gln) amidotransferase subunit B
VNVSVRRPGEPLGTRREIKNLNSFKFMQQAIDYEVQWQIDTIENGGKINQATVLFNPDTGETRMMRSKEEAHDYRYFPDPDLLPLEISEEWKEQIRATLPELPQAEQARYVNELGLSSYDASILTASRETANYFESCVAVAGKNNAKLCANWLMGEVTARLNREGRDFADCPVSATQLGIVLLRLAGGELPNRQIAKELFDTLWAAGTGKQVHDLTFTAVAGAATATFEVTKNIDAIIEAKGLKQVSDTGAIEKIVDEIIAANHAQVAEYRSGKEKVFGFFVGLAMKASKGKANPAQLNEVLKKKLAG